MRMRMRSPLLRLRMARTKQRASNFNIIFASIKKYNNFAFTVCWRHQSPFVLCTHGNLRAPQNSISLPVQDKSLLSPHEHTKEDDTF